MGSEGYFGRVRPGGGVPQPMPTDNLPQLSDEAVNAFNALTPKQQRFVIAFQRTGNAAEAYRQAYDCSNMSDQSIIHEAHILRQNPNISPILSDTREIALSILSESLPKQAERLLKLSSIADDADAPAAKLAVAHRAIATTYETQGMLGKGSQINVNVGIDQRAIQLWQEGGAAAWRDAARPNNDD